MGDLSCFLAQNAAKMENVKYVASKRFIGADKKPVEWEIKAVTTEDDEALKKDCTKRKPIVGKKGAYIPETDYSLYTGRLAAACTVYPNLNDKTLQDSYGVMGALELLQQMLLPGEYQEYLSKVQEVNGFDMTMEELVDEAKN